MKEANKHARPTLDEIIAEVREENLAEPEIEHAADRVWDHLCLEYVAPQPGPTPGVEKIRGCADFQALMPVYLAGNLSSARSLLMQDHLHACVACRRALEQVRRGSQPAAAPLAEFARSLPRAGGTKTRWVVGWALAACVCLMCLSLFLEGGRLKRALRGPEIQATVLTIEGSLYRVSNPGGEALLPGRTVGEDEEIRTAKASSAVIRLADGSTIEIAQRTAFSISNGWRHTTLHLQGGSIIVQAAKQGRRRLEVATRDCLVSVKGTIFGVDEGMKGSRVSVIQGEVEVEQGRKKQLLHPGEQVSTEADLTPDSVTHAVGWSRNRGEYLTLLSEFAALHKQLETLPGPAPRYDSTLLNLLPRDTVFYAAIPNLGSTLGQAHELLQERIRESQVLQDWWNRQQSAAGGNIKAELFDRLRSLSDYLGDEIVFAWAAGQHSPLVLAEVRRPNLREFIETQFAQTQGDGKQLKARIVDNPFALSLVSGDEAALVYLRNNLVAFASDPRELQKVAPLMERSTPSAFVSSPFYGAIRQAYQGGAGLLICADMEQILAHSVNQKEGKGNDFNLLRDERTGFGDVRYLIMESTDVSGRTENRATLTFARTRRGMTAWLGSPSPMGTLDFVSPAASLVISFVVEDPRQILQGSFALAESHDPDFNQQLDEFESQTGINVADDLAGSLGGEATLTLDGPLLPTPSWKVALEVNDPTRLSEAILKLVAAYNQHATSSPAPLTLTTENAGGQTYFRLQFNRTSSAPGAPSEVDYAFVDGYLLATSSPALLLSSIENRSTGYTLARSSDFASRLPHDGFTSCSALAYQNLSAMLGSAADLPVLTPEERQAIGVLMQNSGPSLTCAYGEPQDIVVANTGSLFGMGLDPLLGIKGAGVMELLPLLKGSRQ